MNLLPVKNQIIIGIDPLSKKEHPASGLQVHACTVMEMAKDKKNSFLLVDMIFFVN